MPKSFKRHPNDTATVDCVILHTQDKEVNVIKKGVITNTKKLDEEFLLKLADDFNNKHKGLFKRYPKVLFEHQENVDSVVGRFNAKIDTFYDGDILKLKSQILITDEYLVNHIEEKINGGKDFDLALSIGLSSDDGSNFFIDEVSITSDPHQKHTIMLSNSNQDCNSNEYYTIKLNIEKLEKKYKEQYKVKLVSDALLNQVKRGVILRKDVQRLSSTFDNPEQVVEAYKSIPPIIKKRKINFKR